MEQVSREDFAEFVLNMRKSLSMSREVFSKSLGASVQTVSSWEKQQAYPRKIDEKIKKIRDLVKMEIQKRRVKAK